MLSGPAPFSSPTISTSTSTASPIPPPRLSRLLGLGYLRSYTGGLIEQSPSATEPPSPALEAGQAPRNRQTRRRPVSVSESSGRRRSGLSNGEDSSSSVAQNTLHPATRSPSSASEAPIGGWLPTVDGLASPARPTTQLQPDVGTSGRLETASAAWTRREREDEMTRQRSVTTPATPLLPSLAQAVSLGTSSRSHAPPQGSASRTRQGGLRVTNIASPSPSPTAAEASQPQLPISQLPSIRFVPYSDPRSVRPSLIFPTITRTLPNSSSAIRIGRYSEKDNAPPDLAANAVSDAPVGFKSKVVSRRHCEFFYMENQWHIKDVKSSSGTFLNHIRLSPPGEESKPFAVKDGDLVQLGIDFKGGEEMIFRCVKIRILCNRGWQKSVNKFNKSAHKQLNELQRSTNKQFKESTECTICLNSIAPCQSLFVAPCSHTWHYKCIRPMLEETSRAPGAFAQFLCPNCRALADLEADVEEGPLWEDDFSDEEIEGPQSRAGMTISPSDEAAALLITTPPEDILNADLDQLSLRDGFQHPSFGLPPASTSVSRSDSTRLLNPSASSFVPTSSSALPLPSTPALPVDASASVPASIPSIGPEPLGSSQPSSASNTIRLNQLGFPHFFNGISETPQERPQRHVAPYEDDTISSPDSEHDGIYDPSFPPLDTETISPTSLSSFPSLRQGDAPSLAFATRQQSNGDAADAEGPMTPRNNAGPFVFDGAAASASPDSVDSQSPEFDEAGVSVSLNEAAATT